MVNDDPDVAGRLKVVFFPDFNVKNGQLIYPAADLSEQISTAGKEASGTGNMKFSMNGALTIGTLDGANVEIREEVGAENFFLFGLDAREVQELKSGGYHPRAGMKGTRACGRPSTGSPSGVFSPGDRELFRPLVTHLLRHDDYLLLADYQAYVDARTGSPPPTGTRSAGREMSILNVARMGKFSSDRSIRDYCRDIWLTGPLEP